MRTHLTLGTLAREWYRLRTPIKLDYSLTARPGWLAVMGNPYTISDIASPAAFLVKQKWLDCRLTVKVDYQPSAANEEAGITVYWSCFAYMALLVRKSTRGLDNREVVLQWTAEDSEEVVVSLLLPRTGLTFRSFVMSYLALAFSSSKSERSQPHIVSRMV
jgi:beta-xylosidase